MKKTGVLSDSSSSLLPVLSFTLVVLFSEETLYQKTASGIITKLLSPYAFFKNVWIAVDF